MVAALIIACGMPVKTEASIIQAMERLMAGRTTFIVAHRLATLRHCDVIYSVEDGKLVPTSIETSEPLLANRGLSPDVGEPSGQLIAQA